LDLVKHFQPAFSGSGRGFVMEFPTREDENTRVTLQGSSQDFRTLYPKADSVIFRLLKS
jgi:hypothetical protein